jgi:hypothetical protein
MQFAADILRGLSAYVLIAASAGGIAWVCIPGFGGPLSYEIKLRALTAVVGGGILFAAIVFGAMVIAVNWRA